MRSLNWFGWSIHTIAAAYETDAATTESEQGLIDESYVWAAFAAEEQQRQLDNEQKEANGRHPRP